ncbi:MAG TPA: hypothetical protein VJ916_07325 [Anaerovoracaceae bacterium]|nr:hypothetical protein [Anaerovoracaceae bacterium]
MEFNEKALEVFKKELEKTGNEAVKLEVVQTEDGNSLNVDLKKIEKEDRVVEKDGLKLVLDVDSEVMLTDIVFQADDEGNISMTYAEPSCSSSCGQCCGC